MFIYTTTAPQESSNYNEADLEIDATFVLMLAQELTRSKMVDSTPGGMCCTEASEHAESDLLKDRLGTVAAA